MLASEEGQLLGFAHMDVAQFSQYTSGQAEGTEWMEK